MDNDLLVLWQEAGTLLTPDAAELVTRLSGSGHVQRQRVVDALIRVMSEETRRASLIGLSTSHRVVQSLKELHPSDSPSSWVEDEALAQLALVPSIEPWLAEWGPELLERLDHRGFVRLLDTGVCVLEPLRFPGYIAAWVEKLARESQTPGRTSASESLASNGFDTELARGAWGAVANRSWQLLTDGRDIGLAVAALLQSIAGLTAAAQQNIAARPACSDATHDEDWVERRCLAWVVAANRDHPRAVSLSRSLFRSVRTKNPSRAVAALADMSRFGAPGEALEELRSLGRTHQSGCDALVVQAIASERSNVMADVAQSLNDEGWMFYAYEVAHAARLARSVSPVTSVNPVLPVRSRAGSILLTGKTTRLETPLAQRARQHLASPLTSREALVVSLAARGDTSRSIGAQLGVSHRTVDNLLGRAYAKLGLTGRADLSPELVAAVV